MSTNLVLSRKMVSNNFKICIDTKSKHFLKEVKARENILSEIYISCEDYIFPSENWLDFPVKILSWWLNNFFQNQENTPFTCDFMNGPYEYYMETKMDIIEISFYQKKANETKILLAHSTIFKTSYINSLIKAADDLEKILLHYSYSGSDFEALKTSLARAKLITQN